MISLAPIPAHHFGGVKASGYGRELGAPGGAGTYQPKTDLAGCLNNSTRRIPTDALDVDPVNDSSSRAEKQHHARRGQHREEQVDVRM